MTEDPPTYNTWSHTHPILVRVEARFEHPVDVCIMCDGDGSDGGIIGPYMILCDTGPRKNVITCLETVLGNLHAVNVNRADGRRSPLRPYVWDEALLLRRVGEIIAARYLGAAILPYFRAGLLDGCLFFDPCPDDGFPNLPCLRLTRGELTRWVMPAGIKTGIGANHGIAWGFPAPDSIWIGGTMYGPLQAVAAALGDIVSHEAEEMLLAELNPDGGA